MAVVHSINSNMFKKLCKDLPTEFSNYFNLLKNGETPIYKLEPGQSEEINIGAGIRAIEQCYKTKNRDEAIIESHIKYTDFQYIIEGSEVMETRYIKDLEIKQSYSSESDLIIYKDNVDFHQLAMKTGDFALFYPEDAHRTTLVSKEACTVRKVVIKIPI